MSIISCVSLCGPQDVEQRFYRETRAEAAIFENINTTNTHINHNSVILSGNSNRGLSGSTSSSSGGRGGAGKRVSNKRPGGGSGCERLLLDLDLSFVTNDMDIVLTLRSQDVKSVLPEATVTLSGLVLSGILRLDAELTPEYPFVGNTTVRK